MGERLETKVLRLENSKFILIGHGWQKIGRRMWRKGRQITWLRDGELEGRQEGTKGDWSASEGDEVWKEEQRLGK